MIKKSCKGTHHEEKDDELAQNKEKLFDRYTLLDHHKYIYRYTCNTKIMQRYR